MKYLFLLSFTISSSFIIFSCETGIQTGIDSSFVYKQSRCGANSFMKDVSGDSLFSYSFINSLVLDFSVRANCCPDSGRFIVSKNVFNDTIEIKVLDTAGNNCRCYCRYMIQTEIFNLTGNRYFIKCIQSGSIGNGDVIHFVTVYRKP